ncbi:MAG: cytochrome c [Acidobacteriota bacterium]
MIGNAPSLGGWAHLARRLALLLLIAVAAVGCRQDMQDTPRIEPFEANDFFADDVGSRPIPAGTVPRGIRSRDGDIHAAWDNDPSYWEGVDVAGTYVASFPLAVDQDLLYRGKERYEIFCAPCHDSVGSGQGMIVRRGFKQPSSYHIDRLREAPNGYYFEVISHGFGVMSGYETHIPIEDRWAIIAYIRALQLSRNQRLGDLPSAWRTDFQADLAAMEARPPSDEPAGTGVYRIDAVGLEGRNDANPTTEIDHGEE